MKREGRKLIISGHPNYYQSRIVSFQWLFLSWPLTLLAGANEVYIMGR